mgnify:CR=1 FL=1
MSEKSFNAACTACGTTFAIAPLPISATQLAKVIKTAACPRCGTTKLGVASSSIQPDIPLPPSDQADGQHG